MMNRLLAALAMIFGSVAIFLATRGQTFSRVNANGPTLRMFISGSRGPAVVFEAGAGAPLETWVRVQPAVSKFARTISYDRAGNGLSEQPAAPRDAQHVATELHAALHNAGAAPPYLLVGHSLGGPYIRVFAGTYPDEVLGLVLVDPTQEELIEWAKARGPKSSETHTFRPYDEVDCAPITFEQAKKSPLPPSIPVALIAGMGPRVVPGFLTTALKEETKKDQDIFYPAKLNFYKQWLRNIPGGQLVITENSGHGIPFEEPELVVRAIRETLERAAKGSLGHWGPN